MNSSYAAAVRLGSSTIEKRTPALWRFSSETSRQQSSASLRDGKGPLTCAEPSTSLWKFIEPNSPPLTQKLLPLVICQSPVAVAPSAHFPKFMLHHGAGTSNRRY